MSATTHRRIIYLTAGAGGMFCGSCMHDNTLASALIKQGLDVQLVPIYTPIRTDEDDVSVDQVFFGGINVYLQQKIPLFRYLPRVLDRFLDRPGLIRRVASCATSLPPTELGKLTVSMLRGDRGFQRKEVKRLIDWLKQSAKPDLVVLSNILIGGCIPVIKQELDVPVVVTIQGDDVFLESLPESHRDQALAEISRVARYVDAFIGHSQFYADSMSDYLSIDRDKFHVIPLGIDVEGLQDLSRRSADSMDQVTVGYFARLDPEKGFHLLIDAFIELRKNDPSLQPRLQIAGWLGEHHRIYAEQQFDKLRAAGLESEFEYVGAVDRRGKLDFFQSIDLLAVPTVYREPKGLFALEAMAAGVPVIVPAHGAFPEMIADTGGGILSDPNSVSDLSAQIQRLINDPGRRLQLGQSGRDAVLNRRNAESMARSTQELFDKLLEK